MELWDLYDRQGNRTGETWERKFGNYKLIPEGRYHMVVDILVQHTDGTFLLTKRDMSKDVYPGYWEASAGGAAVAGEDPETAAKRELEEETGLTALSFKLVSHTFRESSHSMFYSYLALVDGDKDSVRLQEGETVEYKWVDRTGLLEYVRSDFSIKTHNDRYKSLFDAYNTLYVTDLDGTLMRNDKSISDNSLNIINGLIARGAAITVATARSVTSVVDIVKPIDISIPLVVRNGTALAAPHTLEIMEKAVFTDEEVSRLKAMLKELPFCGFTSIWRGNEMEKVFFNGPHSAGIEKYLAEHEGEKGLRFVDDVEELFKGDVGYITMIDDKENLDPVYERVGKDFQWESVFQQDSYDSEYWLELCPENSTKAKAIERLKERLGLEKIVAFGDSVNDIPMFKIADESYAVENALPELKEYATAVIASNEEDGVAEFLKSKFV